MMNLKHFFESKYLVNSCTDKRSIPSRKDHYKLLAKYKCKINHINSHVILGEEYLTIQDKMSRYTVACSDIQKVSIQERLWSIRVKLQCKKRLYQFDFPSYKVATKFYEQLIYSKVKALAH